MAKRKGSNDITDWMSSGVELDRRLISIQGGIDDELAATILKGLVILAERVEPIRVVLNTDGGDVAAGLGLYDALKGFPGEVHIHVPVKAYSIGAVILQAGHRRTAAPHASVMIHAGEESIDDTVINVERWRRFSRSQARQMEAALLERMRLKDKGINRTKLRRLLQFDTIYTADQAIEAGLIDEIITFGDFK